MKAARDTLTTKDKLLHIAAQIDQLARELEAIGAPIAQGGASDISFAASHTIGVELTMLHSASRKLQQLAGTL